MQTTFSSKFGTHTAEFNGDGHAYVELGDITVNNVVLHGNIHVHRQPDGSWKPCAPDQFAAWGKYPFAPSAMYLHRRGCFEGVSASAKEKVAVAIGEAITALAKANPSLPHAGAMTEATRELSDAQTAHDNALAALAKAKVRLANASSGITALRNADPALAQAA
jgi:hypothetical protein